MTPSRPPLLLLHRRPPARPRLRPRLAPALRLRPRQHPHLHQLLAPHPAAASRSASGANVGHAQPAAPAQPEHCAEHPLRARLTLCLHHRHARICRRRHRRPVRGLWRPRGMRRRPLPHGLQLRPRAAVCAPEPVLLAVPGAERHPRPGPRLDHHAPTADARVPGGAARGACMQQLVLAVPGCLCEGAGVHACLCSTCLTAPAPPRLLRLLFRAACAAAHAQYAQCGGHTHGCFGHDCMGDMPFPGTCCEPGFSCQRQSEHWWECRPEH